MHIYRHTVLLFYFIIEERILQEANVKYRNNIQKAIAITIGFW